MRASVYLAALAAATPAFAQFSNTTSYFTRCTTTYGWKALSTGKAVPTWYSSATTTNIFYITSTTQSTVTVTPSAAVCTGTITTTSTVITTTTSTPPSVTVPTSAGFQPLLVANAMPASTGDPTGLPRIRGRAHAEALRKARKRQTVSGKWAGFSVNPDGTTSNLNRTYPREVRCGVSVTINTTQIVTVQGDPVTSTLPQSTIAADVTTVITTTQTVTVVAPTPTTYAACSVNNVVDHLIDADGNRDNFNTIIYASASSDIDMVTNTTNGVNCCTVCQQKANCAGSFYAPSVSQCHLRLINSPSNSTSPTGSATAPFPTSTGTPGTCKPGSDYVGVVRGDSSKDFPDKYALVISNGPCGRFSIDLRSRPNV